MSQKIKNCPFCGNSAEIMPKPIKITNDPDYTVKCKSDFCIMRLGTGTSFYTEENAIKAWNIRTETIKNK